MPKAFDISKYAATLNQSVPAETRDIESITAEILEAQRVGGEATLTIGRGLIEAKGKLEHGEWLTWLSERVNYSERTAQRLMKIAREWSNPTVVSDLGARKALALLALPPEERETFIAENNVVDMTSRELEKAIRERDEARKAAEAAQADARHAEESRAKMEEDMKALEAIHRSAQEGEAQARDALAKAQAELKELRERPMDVAVETVVDQEAVERARAEAIAEMQGEVDKLKKALEFAVRQTKEVEAQRKRYEDALADARKEAKANAAILSRAEKAEAEELEEENEEEPPVRRVRWESQGRTPPENRLILTYYLAKLGPRFRAVIWNGSQFCIQDGGEPMSNADFTHWIEIPGVSSGETVQLAPPGQPEGPLVISGWMPGGTFPRQPCEVVAHFRAAGENGKPDAYIRRICWFDGMDFLFKRHGPKLDAECTRWMVLPPVEDDVSKLDTFPSDSGEEVDHR